MDDVSGEHWELDLMAKLLDAVGDVLFVSRLNGGLLHWNRRLIDLTGWTRQDLAYLPLLAVHGRTERENQANLQQLQAARNQQRRKIGRDLHDGIASQLAGMMMRIDRLIKGVCPETGDQLEDLRGVLDRVVEEVRDISQQLTGNTRSRNTLKRDLHHAAADKLLIRVVHIEDMVELKIEDDGTGSQNDDSSGGLGLRTMRSRASEIGGSLELHVGTARRHARPVPSTDLIRSATCRSDLR